MDAKMQAPFPYRWLRDDPRLEGLDDLTLLISEVLSWSLDGIIPADEPDADLLPSPMELVSMLRDAAARIAETTRHYEDIVSGGTLGP